MKLHNLCGVGIPSLPCRELAYLGRQQLVGCCPSPQGVPMQCRPIFDLVRGGVAKVQLVLGLSIH